MSLADNTDKWNRVTGIVFVIALVLSAAVASVTEIFNAAFVFLIVTGIYFAVSFYIREGGRSNGPSAVDGAIMGGILLAGIGVCGFIYYFTSNITITSIAIVAVMILAIVPMVVRNRKYL